MHFSPLNPFVTLFFLWRKYLVLSRNWGPCLLHLGRVAPKTGRDPLFFSISTPTQYLSETPPLTSTSENSRAPPCRLQGALKLANELLCCECSHRTQNTFHMWRFFSPPSQAYLELASEVFVRGALSALLQRDESKASEISRAAS